MHLVRCCPWRTSTALVHLLSLARKPLLVCPSYVLALPCPVSNMLSSLRCQLSNQPSKGVCLAYDPFFPQACMLAIILLPPPLLRIEVQASGWSTVQNQTSSLAVTTKDLWRPYNIGTHLLCGSCPAAGAAEVKRTSDECGFSGLAARLFKLLGLVAHTIEDRVLTAAFKAAGALCDFASARSAWLPWRQSEGPAGSRSPS